MSSSVFEYLQNSYSSTKDKPETFFFKSHIILPRPLNMYWFSVSIVFAFLAVVNAGCTGANWKNGRLHALCTDEVTGHDFEFIDLEDQFKQLSIRRSDGVSVAVSSGDELNGQIYDWYEDAASGNSTNVDGSEGHSRHEKRLRNLWQRCVKWVSGACGNDHVIAWVGTASDLVSNIIAIVSEVNTGNRENKSPRSVCYKYAASHSRVCVSWAAVSQFHSRTQ